MDRIYIGHMPEVGASALTGVGLFTPILMLITAFAMLCGSGGAPRAAIAMGRGDDDAAEKIMGNCFTLLLILAASFLLCGPLQALSPRLKKALYERKAPSPAGMVLLLVLLFLGLMRVTAGTYSAFIYFQF